MKNLIMARLVFLFRNNKKVSKLYGQELAMLSYVKEQNIPRYSNDDYKINRTILLLLYELKKDFKNFKANVTPIYGEYNETLARMKKINKKQIEVTRTEKHEKLFDKYDKEIGNMLKHKPMAHSIVRNMKFLRKYFEMQKNNAKTKQFVDEFDRIFTDMQKDFIELYAPIYNLTNPD